MTCKEQQSRLNTLLSAAEVRGRSHQPVLSILLVLIGAGDKTYESLLAEKLNSSETRTEADPLGPQYSGPWCVSGVFFRLRLFKHLSLPLGPSAALPQEFLLPEWRSPLCRPGSVLDLLNIRF